MTEQEAINELEVIREHIENLTNETTVGRAITALTGAIEALELRIPKMPDIEGDGYADGHLVYDTWICPHCGKHYEMDYNDYNNCPECGQRIDWRAIKESPEDETETEWNEEKWNQREWIESDIVQEHFRLSFEECMKKFDFSRKAEWNPPPLNGQKITCYFRKRAEKE